MKKIILSAAMLTGVVALAQNTGIGTTNPQAKLDVANTIRIDRENKAQGVSIVEYATPWERGFNFSDAGLTKNYGGFYAYGKGSNNTPGVEFFGIGYRDTASEANNAHVPIVKFYQANKLTELQGG